MKKLLISALALASLVACSKEELVVEQTPGAIGFDQMFVGKATRAAEDPSITKATLGAFDAWGFMEQGSGLVFDQQRVTSSDEGNTWTYAPLQYWLPNHMYYFSAVAPVDDSNIIVEKAAGNDLYNGLGTIKFTNANGKTDLLYAATTVDTEGWIAGEAKEKVSFSFSHLLSKVKFSFKNGFLADNYSIVVKDIKMTVPGDGEINVAVENWWDNDDWKLGTTSTILEFGHMNAGARIGSGLNAESDYERLTIPADASHEYEVSFFVELYSGDVLAYSNALKTTVKGAALNMGYAYNFVATLDHTNIAGTELKPIEFEVVEVKKWEEGNIYDGESIDTEVIGVATAEDLQSALNGIMVKSEETSVNEVSIRLLNDITLTPSPLQVGTNVSATLDLNGKTLKHSENWIESDNTENSYVFYVPENAELTIKGEGTVEAIASQYAIAVWANGGKANIYGGTYKNFGEGSDLIYAKNGGKINIYGGTFIACEKQEGTEGTKEKYSALNLHDTDKGQEIVVYGGEFRGFDPANNLSENPAKSFVAAGYISIKTAIEGDDVAWYNVVPAGTLQEVATAAELQNALNAGGENIVLTADITTDKSFFVNEKVSAVLNLNGKNITNKATSDELEVADGFIVYGKLTINGNGTISAPTRAIWARANTGAVININGGTYIGSQAADGACEVIYASGNGKIFITDGVFQAVNEDKKSFAAPQYAALNLQANGKSGCSIEVKGGKFYRFDPANNVSENRKQHSSNFVAEGYMSYKVDANWYAVTDKITRVSTEDELHAALANGGAIQLTKNIESVATFNVTAENGATLDLNGYTVKNITPAKDVIIVKTSLVINDANNNGVLEAVSEGDGYTVISEGSLTINGGTFKSGVDANNKPNAVIYARGNGKVFVNGGYFPNDNTSKYVLNKKDADRETTTIEVKGGTYGAFNPGNNAAEGTGTNFLAAGYKSVETAEGSNNWTVIAE